MSVLIKLHALLHKSRVNGPGSRTVIHTQGCHIRCKGCFNPETHSISGGKDWEVDVLINEVLKADTRGLTVSGGEPTEQLESLVIFLERLKERWSGTIILFSGRSLAEIREMPLGLELLANLDVLIDGPFEISNGKHSSLAGSKNQGLHLLTDRIKKEDFGSPEVEIHITSSGEVIMTGFPPPSLVRAVSELGE